jgi:hypothetical protein
MSHRSSIGKRVNKLKNEDSEIKEWKTRAKDGGKGGKDDVLCRRRRGVA